MMEGCSTCYPKYLKRALRSALIRLQGNDDTADNGGNPPFFYYLSTKYIFVMILLKSLSEMDYSNKDEVRAQIKVRRSLLEQMVGTLYPSILKEEIIILNTYL